MLQESLSIQEATGEKGEVTVVLDNLGYAYAAAGQVATAREHFARAVKLARDMRKVPIIMDILLGWSATLAQPDEAEQAVALITFVAEHPSTWRETKDRAARWLAEHARGLSPAALEGAQARGRALKYEGVVLMALGQSSLATEPQASDT